MPAVTLPPGEFMYKFIGFSGFSASRNNSCATITAATLSSTWIQICNVKNGNSQKHELCKNTHRTIQANYTFFQESRENIIRSLASALLQTVSGTYVIWCLTFVIYCLLHHERDQCLSRGRRPGTRRKRSLERIARVKCKVQQRWITDILEQISMEERFWTDYVSTCLEECKKAVFHLWGMLWNSCKVLKWKLQRRRIL